jgi:hypothetical protein
VASTEFKNLHRVEGFPRKEEERIGNYFRR